jgi:hypothetical protein
MIRSYLLLGERVMSPRQSNILILIQIVLTTLCLFVAALLLPQTGYSAAEIVSDSPPPPPSPRTEHVPAARYGYAWAPGHWQWNGDTYHWVSGTWMEQGGAPRIPDDWQQMDGRWRYLLRHWERQ